MINVQHTIEQKQFNQSAWDAFTKIPTLNELWGSTIQSVWRDDCLYVIEANLQVRVMKVQLVYFEEPYDDCDLREHTFYLIDNLKKLFLSHGITIITPDSYADYDPRYNELTLTNN